MNAGGVSGANRPSRRLTLVSLLGWALIALAIPLLALTLNAFQVAGFPLGFWFTAQGALVALAGLALLFARRVRAAKSGEGLLGSAVFAGEAIGSAGFIGYAGLIALVGFDALSYPLGVAAGLALMAILIAPRFALYPVATTGGFFTARFGGLWPRRLMLTILLVATLMLLAADIRGAGLAIQALTGVDRPASFAIVAVVLSVSWLGLELAGGRRRWGLVFAALLAAFSLVLIVIALTQKRLPLPYWSYGVALREVADLEIGLMTKKLADVRAIKPMTSAFLQYSMWNFTGIVLAVALGLAALPQLLGRHVSQAAGAPAAASRRVALALTLVAVFLCGLAPYAVFARVSLAELVQPGLAVADLPRAVTQVSAQGWLEVCGAQSGSSAEIAAACAKAPGHKGLLRLQDLNFEPDAYVFAVSAVSGVPILLRVALAAAALLAALVAGHALVSGYLSADAEARRTGPAPRQRLDARSVALGILLLLGAVLVAAGSPSGIAALAGDGLALLAASVFPALLMGLVWRRYGAAGAIATLVTGFVAAAVYIFGLRLVPGLVFELTGDLSTAPPSAVAKFASLKAVAAAATEPAARLKAEAALHAQAATIANWWGLKTPAAVLFALPMAVAAGLVVTLLTPRSAVAAKAA
jgi:putative solute:sodium symporter small subunit